MSLFQTTKLFDFALDEVGTIRTGLHEALRSSKVVTYYYLLRLVLKVTLWLGRSFDRRSVLMVSTSSRAKSNNSVAGNKLNSDYFSFYSLA